MGLLCTKEQDRGLPRRTSAGDARPLRRNPFQEIMFPFVGGEATEQMTKARGAEEVGGKWQPFSAEKFKIGWEKFSISFLSLPGSAGAVRFGDVECCQLGGFEWSSRLCLLCLLHSTCSRNQSVLLLLFIPFFDASLSSFCMGSIIR